MPHFKKTAVMVIGGAEDKIHGKEILVNFFARSGGENARIAIIPSASREPVIIGIRYNTIFEEMGAKNVAVIDIREREQCDHPVWQNYIQTCTGIFFTGGDQLRLWALLSDTPMMEMIRLRAQANKVTLAGTSAGAAVMGHHMIAGGGSGECPNRSLTDMATGLGILPELIVDQHFHNRNRMARLLSAIAIHPDKIGMGVDEDTCAIFEGDDKIQVTGKGVVTIVDPGEMSYTNGHQVDNGEPIRIHNLRIHLLGYGDSYDLKQRAASYG